MRDRQQISHEAAALLESCGIRKIPVPIKPISKRLGVTVQRAKFDDREISGMIYRDDGKTVIGINTLHSKPHQRLTFAHEVGHLVLHDFQIHVDQRHTVPLHEEDMRNHGSEADLEAIWFALALLIPIERLRDELKDKPFDLDGSSLIPWLARKFRVSPQALAYRLMVPGLE